MPAVPRLAAAVLLWALAGAGVACGGDDKADRLEPTRTALERTLLDNLRRTTGLEATTSVSCAPHGDGVASWDCALAGGERRTLTVAVDRHGAWQTNIPGVAPPSLRPRTIADGWFVGELNSGTAISGCCIPLPK